MKFLLVTTFLLLSYSSALLVQAESGKWLRASSNYHFNVLWFFIVENSEALNVPQPLVGDVPVKIESVDVSPQPLEGETLQVAAEPLAAVQREEEVAVDDAQPALVQEEPLQSEGLVGFLTIFNWTCHYSFLSFPQRRLARRLRQFHDSRHPNSIENNVNQLQRSQRIVDDRDEDEIEAEERGLRRRKRFRRRRTNNKVRRNRKNKQVAKRKGVFKRRRKNNNKRKSKRGSPSRRNRRRRNNRRRPTRVVRRPQKNNKRRRRRNPNKNNKRRPMKLNGNRNRGSRGGKRPMPNLRIQGLNDTATYINPDSLAQSGETRIQTPNGNIVVKIV